MRLGLIGGMSSDWQRSLEKVRAAEDLGYEMITAGEAWGTSVLPWLTLIATNTSRIRIGTSILNCFSRSPAALAQEFSVLDQLSGGRMTLGLGSSGANVIEHFHGLPFERPLQRIREYVDIFNLLISGEKLDYQGKVFQLGRGFRLEYERPRDHIPVYIAAITPRSIVQTGEIADGILPIHWPKQRFAELRKELDAAQSAAGRGGSEMTIAPFTHVWVLDGKNDEKLWQSGRQQLFFYINRMGTFYWQMLERNGYEEEVSASRKAWADRDMKGAMAAISERMIRDIQVVGPAESCREQLEARSELGADLQLLYMPPGDPETVARTLESLIR
jgi:alkanesulfonate monooxygenase SsuD/methylene tetrahydromethanopterin reductase-like flavin-dependent oxidoreductase (luciferase family)